MQDIIYIGLDDTDTLTSRGTGHLARMLAEQLSDDYRVLGVTRHQLLKDPRVPCTSNNSSAAILLQAAVPNGLEALFESVQEMVMADFQPGSDPGVCVTTCVPKGVTAFGRRVQTELVSQGEALDLAAEHGILLCGLGGTNDGVIGALSAVGLACCGEDGRYVMTGSLRELSGVQPVEVVLHAGAAAVRTLEGESVHHGNIITDKLRPARRGAQPVVFVEASESYWQPLKLD